MYLLRIKLRPKKYFGRNEFFNSVIFEGDENDIGKLVKVNIEKVIKILFLEKLKTI